MISTNTTKTMKGTNMSKLRTKIAVILGFALAISPIAFYSANAASGGPTDSVVTLVSPFLDASNTSEATKNQQMADEWVAKGWFGSGLLFQVSFAPVGSTINLTYHVSDKTGKALAFQAVNLRINKGYSESMSHVSVDGVRTSGNDRPPFDQANVIHRTDAFGNVTFALKSLDDASLAEPQPDSYTSKPAWVDAVDRLHSQMLPEVNSEPADHSVITEFHYFIPKAPITVAATKPTIRLVSPALDSTNSVSSNNLKQAYAPAGGDIVVVYKVLGDDGVTAVPNAQVSLKVNGGKSTLSATSDAFGYAVFTVKNADTKPNAAPASATAAMPKASTAYANLKPEIAGTTAAAADAVEFHYYRGITTSAVKAGGSYTLSVGIAGAAGKSATVAVSGASKVTAKINAAYQVVPVKVTAGAKTVTVTIDGKAYTSKITVK